MAAKTAARGWMSAGKPAPTVKSGVGSRGQLPALARGCDGESQTPQTTGASSCSDASIMFSKGQARWASPTGAAMPA